MLRHLFLCSIKFKNRYLYGILLIIKRIILQPINDTYYGNRNRKVKWFCEFGKVKCNSTKLNEIRFIEAIL